MSVDPGVPKGDRGLIGWGGGGQGPKLPKPPKQARGAEKRDRIYAVAIARFRQAGVAGTTVDEVIAAADEHGLAMVFTGVRHFRH